MSRLHCPLTLAAAVLTTALLCPPPGETFKPAASLWTFVYVDFEGNPAVLSHSGRLKARTSGHVSGPDCPPHEDMVEIHPPATCTLAPTGDSVDIPLGPVTSWIGCFTSGNTAESFAFGHHDLHIDATPQDFTVEGLLHGQLTASATDSGPSCCPNGVDPVTSAAKSELSFAGAAGTTFRIEGSGINFFFGRLDLNVPSFPPTSAGQLNVKSSVTARLYNVSGAPHPAHPPLKVWHDNGKGKSLDTFANILSEGLYALVLDFEYTISGAVSANCCQMSQILSQAAGIGFTLRYSTTNNF